MHSEERFTYTVHGCDWHVIFCFKWFLLTFFFAETEWWYSTSSALSSGRDLNGPYIIDKVEVRTFWRLFQTSSWWFEVFLNASELNVLLYFIHFVRCTRFTGSKTAIEHDATTTMLNSSKHTHLWSLWINNSIFVSSHHKTFLQKPFLSPCDQLQTLVKLERVSFEAGASFLHSTLSVHGDVKLAWL